MTWFVQVAVLAVLAGGVALAWRRAPMGSKNKNVLSVALVVLCAAFAFFVCFGLGKALHELRAATPAHASVPGPRQLALSASASTAGAMP